MNEELKKPSGFLWMDEWAELTADLTNEQIGILLRSAQNFHMGNPYDIGEDKELKMAFRFISNCIKQNDEKYGRACRLKAEARERQIRNRNKKNVIIEDMPTNAEISEDMPTNADYQNTNTSTNQNTNTNTNQNTNTNTTPYKKGVIISPPLPPEGETAKKKEKKPKEQPRAVTKYDEAFEEAYLKHKGLPFAWSKRENIACNSIVGKIAAIMAAQGQVPTDASKLDAFRWFIGKVATNGDDWMRANFTPHVIDSKFNEYYQRIKSQGNGTARNNNQNPYGVSDEYLARIARELGGVLSPK